MKCYSVQPRDQIFVKDYRFLYFTRNIGKSVDKNISKNLSSKYKQELLHHTNLSATDTLKTASKRPIRKTAEVTDDLIGSKIADKIKESQKLHQRIIQKQMKKKILRERFIPSELR